jgi:hypothetical protein
MKLQEIFDQLTTAEFSQISIGGQPAGVINDANMGKVLSALNLGLSAIFKRFTIKMGEVSLKRTANVYLYRLHKDHSVLTSYPLTAPKYLQDTVQAPFMDDVLKIEDVLLDSGLALPLNDASDIYSVLTPSAKILQMPAAVVDQIGLNDDRLKTANFRVRYRADHPRLLLPGSDFALDPAEVELELPYAYLEALLWFVASRANNTIGMGQEFNAGNTYYAKFEAECQKLEGLNLEVDQGQDSDRIHRNGWV